MGMNMESKKELSSSLEDYLEAIYNLVNRYRVARSKDIASDLNVSRASVTNALRHLSNKGLINYDPYQFITLTKKGETKAKQIVRRHEILKEFFVDVLSVDTELADSSACKMEHAISGKVLDKLLLLARFLKVNVKEGKSWVREFNSFCKNVEKETFRDNITL